VLPVPPWSVYAAVVPLTVKESFRVARFDSEPPLFGVEVTLLVEPARPNRQAGAVAVDR